MSDVVDFTINGQRYHLTREQVVRVMCGASPDEIRTHSVEVGGTRYPREAGSRCGHRSRPTGFSPAPWLDVR